MLRRRPSSRRQSRRASLPFGCRRDSPGAWPSRRPTASIDPGANLTVNTPLLSAAPRAVAVGVRVWADCAAVFAAVPPMLLGAAFWPGLDHTLPALAEVDLAAGEGTVFVMCPRPPPAELEAPGSGWVALGPMVDVTGPSGDRRLSVWARPVSPEPSLRVLEPGADLEGAVVAFKDSAHQPTTGFGLTGKAPPSAPRALVLGIEVWPGSTALVAMLPEVLAGAPFWTVGRARGLVFDTDVNGTLLLLVEPGVSAPPPPWEGAGPIVGVVSQEGAGDLLGWSQPIPAGSHPPPSAGPAWTRSGSSSSSWRRRACRRRTSP